MLEIDRLGSYFDHTVLKADASINDIDTLIDEALRYKFKSVCVNSCYVKHCYDRLKDSGVDVCAVIGFPLGAMCTKAKVFESTCCIDDGANEIDMVINVGLFKSGKFDELKEDIKAVCNTCHARNVIVKVILESCLLNASEIKIASEISINCGADFIKTSTGFNVSGATTEAVEIMLQVANPVNKSVKASGGIRDGRTALTFINLGVDRLGTSATVKIYNEIIEIMKNPDTTVVDKNNDNKNGDSY